MDKNSNNNSNDNDNSSNEDIDKPKGVNWDGIWKMPDWTNNGSFAFMFPFETDSNQDPQNSFIWNAPFFQSPVDDSLNNLLEALEDAVEANLENAYLNSKVIDSYSKYKVKD